MGNFLRGGGICGQELTLEVRAAQAPLVYDLSVVVAEGGVSAGCRFSGYESNDYQIELFLNGVGENDTVVEIDAICVPVPDGGIGMVYTKGRKVETGIYKATVIVGKNEGGSLSMVSFTDSALYHVTKDGENYIVEPSSDIPDKDAGMGEDKAEFAEAGQRDGQSWEWDALQDGDMSFSERQDCSHNIEYEIQQEADPEQDALLAGVCSLCGDVLSYFNVPNSAYAAFLMEAVKSILDVQEGEVLIETQRWVSFNQMVFDAISQRPKTAVTINYKYEGKLYTVTIPAGADVDGLCKESVFCGFRYLDQVFEGREIG